MSESAWDDELRAKWGDHFDERKAALQGEMWRGKVDLGEVTAGRWIAIVFAVATMILMYLALCSLAG